MKTFTESFKTEVIAQARTEGVTKTWNYYQAKLQDNAPAKRTIQTWFKQLRDEEDAIEALSQTEEAIEEARTLLPAETPEVTPETSEETAVIIGTLRPMTRVDGVSNVVRLDPANPYGIIGSEPISLRLNNAWVQIPDSLRKPALAYKVYDQNKLKGFTKLSGETLIAKLSESFLHEALSLTPFQKAIDMIAFYQQEMKESPSDLRLQDGINNNFLLAQEELTKHIGRRIDTDVLETQHPGLQTVLGLHTGNRGEIHLSVGGARQKLQDLFLRQHGQHNNALKTKLIARATAKAKTVKDLGAELALLKLYTSGQALANKFSQDNQTCFARDFAGCLELLVTAFDGVTGIFWRYPTLGGETMKGYTIRVIWDDPEHKELADGTTVCEQTIMLVHPLDISIFHQGDADGDMGYLSGRMKWAAGNTNLQKKHFGIDLTILKEENPFDLRMLKWYPESEGNRCQSVVAMQTRTAIGVMTNAQNKVAMTALIQQNANPGKTVLENVYGKVYDAFIIVTEPIFDARKEGKEHLLYGVNHMTDVVCGRVALDFGFIESTLISKGDEKAKDNFGYLKKYMSEDGFLQTVEFDTEAHCKAFLADKCQNKLDNRYECQITGSLEKLLRMHRKENFNTIDATMLALSGKFSLLTSPRGRGSRKPEEFCLNYLLHSLPGESKEGTDPKAVAPVFNVVTTNNLQEIASYLQENGMPVHYMVDGEKEWLEVRFGEITNQYGSRFVPIMEGTNGTFTGFHTYKLDLPSVRDMGAPGLSPRAAREATSLVNGICYAGQIIQPMTNGQKGAGRIAPMLFRMSRELSIRSKKVGSKPDDTVSINYLIKQLMAPNLYELVDFRSRVAEAILDGWIDAHKTDTVQEKGKSKQVSAYYTRPGDKYSRPVPGGLREQINSRITALIQGDQSDPKNPLNGQEVLDNPHKIYARASQIKIAEPRADMTPPNDLNAVITLVQSWVLHRNGFDVLATSKQHPGKTAYFRGHNLVPAFLQGIAPLAAMGVHKRVLREVVSALVQALHLTHRDAGKSRVHGDISTNLKNFIEVFVLNADVKGAVVVTDPEGNLVEGTLDPETGMLVFPEGSVHVSKEMMVLLQAGESRMAALRPCTQLFDEGDPGIEVFEREHPMAKKTLTQEASAGGVRLRIRFAWNEPCSTKLIKVSDQDGQKGMCILEPSGARRFALVQGKYQEVHMIRPAQMSRDKKASTAILRGAASLVNDELVLPANFTDVDGLRDRTVAQLEVAGMDPSGQLEVFDFQDGDTEYELPDGTFITGLMVKAGRATGGWQMIMRTPHDDHIMTKTGHLRVSSHMTNLCPEMGQHMKPKVRQSLEEVLKFWHALDQECALPGLFEIKIARLAPEEKGEGE